MHLYLACFYVHIRHVQAGKFSYTQASIQKEQDQQAVTLCHWCPAGEGAAMDTDALSSCRFWRYGKGSGVNMEILIYTMGQFAALRQPVITPLIVLLVTPARLANSD